MTLRTAVRLWLGAIAGAALVAAAGCEKGSGSSSLGSGHDFGDKDPNVPVAKRLAELFLDRGLQDLEVEAK